MDIFFAEAKPGDAEELSEFRRKVWESTYRGIYPDKMIDEFDYKFHNEKDLLRINSEEYSVYFIIANGQKAGYFILQHKNPLYVQSLYLFEDFQGMGIGRKVFEFIRSRCRKDKIKSFYLGCHPQNIRALGFYEKLGGVITARDEGHENNNENSLRIEFKV